MYNDNIKEYRGFSYTKEFKKDLMKFWGIKVKILIDNYLDKNVSKISFNSDKEISNLEFIKESNNTRITMAKTKIN